MRSAILSLCLASLAAATNVVDKRQNGFDPAADALISTYLGTLYPELSATWAAAASAASITGNVDDLIFSALQTSPRPQWFQDAVPTQYSSNIAALEASVDALRTAAGGAVPLPTAVVVTTTNAAGETITTSVTSTVAGVVVTTTDSAGSTITTTSAAGTTSGGSGGGSSSSSSGLAAMPTAFANGAAGVAALVGLAMAL